MLQEIIMQKIMTVEGGISLFYCLISASSLYTYTTLIYFFYSFYNKNIFSFLLFPFFKLFMLSATRLVRTLYQRRGPFTRLYRSFHSHTDPRVEKAVYVTNERGSNVIHDPLLSKGTAFTLDERERLAIRGLLPPRHQEMEKQLLRVKRNLDACPTPLSKYIYLAALHDRNETLYYKLLMKHMNELASIVYTPTGKKNFILST